MKYTKLGATGLEVSRICFGCMSFGSKQWREWVLEEHDARPFYRRAYEHGINFYDTANMYSDGASEILTGKFLAEMAPRDRFVIATKVNFPMGNGPNARGLSRKHIIEQCDASLKRLNTDYIDLYQIHRWDPSTPIDETIRALDDLVRAGKVLYVGASSMYAWQFALALFRADALGATRFVSMQNHYNLVYREEEREMLPFCRTQGIGVIPWSPLARGFLTRPRERNEAADTVRARTDEYSRGLYFKDNDYAILDAVLKVSERLGHSPARIALAWLLQQDGVTAPIIGSTTIAHIDDAIAALDVRLDEADMLELESPYLPHNVAGMAAPERKSQEGRMWNL